MSRNGLAHSEGFKQKCQQLYIDGLSINEVAGLMGCGKSSVFRWVGNKSNRRFRIGDSLVNEVREMYKKGMDTLEIAKKFNVSRQTIANWCKGIMEPVGTRTRGEKNGSWRGGVTSVYELVRKCDKYLVWRKTVFMRDRFTCVECGCKKSGFINADHIKPFWIVMTENNIKSLEDAYKCKELWDIKNGRTLCIDCHHKTDTWGAAALKWKNNAVENYALYN